MKTIALVISAFVAVSGFAQDIERTDTQAVSGEKILIHQLRVTMPNGVSKYEASLPPSGETPLLIQFRTEASCPRSAYVTAYVHSVERQNWEETNVVGNYDHYSGGAIDGIRLVFNQPFYQMMTCTWSIYSSVGLVDVEIPGTEKLIGAINYPGGFAQNLELALESPKLVTQFRAEIPSFCPDTSILEAFTISEGIADKAVLKDPKNMIFSVNKGNGFRISKIQMTLNGPASSVCQIPVFINEK